MILISRFHHPLYHLSTPKNEARITPALIRKRAPFTPLDTYLIRRSLSARLSHIKTNYDNEASQSTLSARHDGVSVMATKWRNCLTACGVKVKKSSYQAKGTVRLTIGVFLRTQLTLHVLWIKTHCDDNSPREQAGIVRTTYRSRQSMMPTDGYVPLNVAPVAVYSSTAIHTRYTRDWSRCVLTS